MALYFDPQDIVLSPNALALAFITSGQGSFTYENQNVGGFNVTKVTYHKTSNTFGATRIEAISNSLPGKVFLSQKGPEFQLPGTSIKLREVAAAVLTDPIGQILVWDTSNCDGNGYHVFDASGNPIPQEPHLSVFHELSHAYHNAIGTSLPDLAAMEALAISETNLLRSELGIAELRDPNDHGGGCGPGAPKPWWEKFVLDIEQLMEMFLISLSTPAPRGVPQRVAEQLRNNMRQSAWVSVHLSSQIKAVKYEFDITKRCLASYYRCAAIALNPDRSESELQLELALAIANRDHPVCPQWASARTHEMESTDAFTVFVMEPLQIIESVYKASNSTSASMAKIVSDFAGSVATWYSHAQGCNFSRDHALGESTLGIFGTSRYRRKVFPDER